MRTLFAVKTAASYCLDFNTSAIINDIPHFTYCRLMIEAVHIDILIINDTLILPPIYILVKYFIGYFPFLKVGKRARASARIIVINKRDHAEYYSRIVVSLLRTLV